MYRSLRLPRISSAAADLLREFDRHGLLGSGLMVVGTNAMAAYEIEAGLRFATASGVDGTLDFDMTWVAEARQTTPIALTEQDWLLPGRRVEHIVCGLDGLSTRVIAPDQTLPGTSYRDSGRAVGEKLLGPSARPCSVSGIETATFVVAGSRSRR